MKNHRDNSVMVVNKWKMYQNLYRTIFHSKTLHVIIHQIVSVRVRQQFSQWLNVDWRKFCMFVQVVQYVQRRRLLQIFRQAAVEGDQSYIFWPQVLSEICYQFLVCTVAIFAVPLARKTGALFASMSGHVKCVL